MTQPPLHQAAAHDVIATFGSMTSARRAIQALQIAGLDAGVITLFGPGADEAAADLEVAAADAGFAADMWRRSWVGALVGGAIGALFGVVVAGLALWGVLDRAIGVYLAAVGGATFLGIGTGAAAGAVSAAQMSSAWELTFHAVREGALCVGVHTDDAREAARAAAILDRQSPTLLERFDLSGA